MIIIYNNVGSADFLAMTNFEGPNGEYPKNFNWEIGLKVESSLKHEDYQAIFLLAKSQQIYFFLPQGGGTGPRQSLYW